MNLTHFQNLILPSLSPFFFFVFLEWGESQDCGGVGVSITRFSLN